MELSEHPSMPRLTVRIGVSGHREIDRTKINRIRADLDAVFAMLDRTIGDLAGKYSGYFDPRGPLKRLISPLAEGADTLTVEAALARGYEIQSPLPFSIDEYSRDFNAEKRQELDLRFTSADAVFELDGHREGERVEEASYLAAGYLTLRQCDMLIAVWDGQAARGIGGTAMIVEAAVQRGIPVIWIHSDNAAAPCLVRNDLLCGPPLEEIRGYLWQILAPPFAPDGSSPGDEFSVRIKRGADAFFREVERRINYGVVFQLFQSLVTRHAPSGLSLRFKPFTENTTRDWSSFGKVVGDQKPEIWRRIETTLAPRFAWADGLAKYYAALYRSSYVLNYLLGALAVFLALSSLILDVNKLLCVIFEMLSILAILGITTTGRRRRWHERWIDYRQLAEQLRHLRFLYLAGAASPNAASRNAYDSGSTEGSWVQWYYQATVRELGLAPANASQRYVTAVKRLFLDEEVRGQIEYHRRNAQRMHAFDHSLHKAGDLLFLSALTICAGYLAFAVTSHFSAFKLTHVSKDEIGHWVMFASAFLPALGAAMSGIRVQGEFASTAERAEAMVTRLTQLQQELLEDDKAGESGLARLRSFIEAISETMLIENVDWRFVYRGKPLSLPA